jgi:ubiquitin-protein ligase/ribosomal protein S25
MNLQDRLQLEKDLLLRYEPKFRPLGSTLLHFGGILQDMDEHNENKYAVRVFFDIPNEFPEAPPIIRFEPDISHPKISLPTIMHPLFNIWNKNTNLYQVVRALRAMFSITPPKLLGRNKQERAVNVVEKENMIERIYLGGNYKVELVNLTTDFCKKVEQELGNFISFLEFHSLFRKYYDDVNNRVSIDDLEAALLTLQDKKIIRGIKVYFDTKFVEISAFSLSEDLEKVIKYCEKKRAITKDEIITKLGLDILKTMKILQILENWAILRKVDKYSSGPIWFVIKNAAKIHLDFE